MALTLLNERSIKPPEGTQLNLGHELTDKMIFCAPFNEGAGRAVDALSQVAGDPSANSGTSHMSWQNFPEGIAYKNNGTTGVGGNFVGPIWPTANSKRYGLVNSNVSMVVGFAFATVTNPVLLGLYNSTTRIIAISYDNTQPATNAQLTVVANANFVQAAWTPSTGTYYIVGFTYDNKANACQLYLNGAKLGSSGAAAALTGTITSLLVAATFDNAQVWSGGQLNGRIVFGYIWNRALSASEHRQVYDNPWQIFQPAAPYQRFWLVPAVGGGPPFLNEPQNSPLELRTAPYGADSNATVFLSSLYPPVPPSDLPAPSGIKKARLDEPSQLVLGSVVPVTVATDILPRALRRAWVEDVPAVVIGAVRPLVVVDEAHLASLGRARPDEQVNPALIVTRPFTLDADVLLHPLARGRADGDVNAALLVTHPLTAEGERLVQALGRARHLAETNPTLLGTTTPPPFLAEDVQGKALRVVRILDVTASGLYVVVTVNAAGHVGIALLLPQIVGELPQVLQSVGLGRILPSTVGIKEALQ